MTVDKYNFMTILRIYLPSEFQSRAVPLSLYPCACLPKYNEIMT